MISSLIFFSLSHTYIKCLIIIIRLSFQFSELLVYVLSTTYSFARGVLEGLGAGVGVFVTGPMQNDDANTLELPTRVSLDAMLSYFWDPFEIRLNGSNLTDQEAYLPIGTIYRGVIPFVLIQMAALILVIAVPSLVLSLPHSMR